MKVAIYALNIVGSIDDERDDSPFNMSFSPPIEKNTVFIGHPSNRRSLPGTPKKRIVVVPDSAVLDGVILKWRHGNELKSLTAEEVFSYATNRLNGFRFDEG